MNLILKTVFFLALAFTTSSYLYAEGPLQADGSSPADGSTQTEEQASQKEEQSKPAAKQYYIVEVVLFRQLNKQGKLDEFWNRPDIFNDLSSNNAPQDNLTDDSPALAEYDLQSRRFSPLRNGIAETSAGRHKLADSAAHLRYSPNYQVLAHFGWTQRSLSKKRALPIRIISNQFSDALMPQGEIKLYVSRFLHMQVDLKASQCVHTSSTTLDNSDGNENENVSDQELDQQLEQGLSKLETETLEVNNTSADTQCINNIYTFKQNRKMRSNELHYIDNPTFGMLVYVTPFSITANQ